MEREDPTDSPRDPGSVCFEETSSSETELDVSSDSVVSYKSTVSSSSRSSNTLGKDSVQAGSISDTLGEDRVQVGSTSDRFVHISVIVMNAFCDDLLKTKLCCIYFKFVDFYN